MNINRPEDDVKTQKSFVVLYDFMYSLLSQRTWKSYSAIVTLVRKMTSNRIVFLEAAATYKVTQKLEIKLFLFVFVQSLTVMHELVTSKAQKDIFYTILNNP